MMKSSKPGKQGITPKEFARQGIRRIRENKCPVHAEAVQHYFKETVKAYGLRMPDLRKLERALFRLTERTWTKEEALELCEILLPKKYLEEKALALITLRRFEKQLGVEFVRTAEGWLARNYCDSWAIVDALCPSILGTVIDNHPPVIPKVLRWTRSRNRWLRRASAVSFVNLARSGRHLDAAYDVALRLLHDKKDDLVHKANGWMLRGAGDADPRRLERFLLKYGPSIPRTTLRYAIEHFPEKKRKGILTRTSLG
ncbi:MAG: DNA alkylation repair protein [Candidatus Eisenbacteria sp.]|nr:DNA alkylation repair protein [Candidatus Eisenbacteria bacterium]